MPKYFLVNGKEIQDDTEIANAFNTYYTQIGPKLAASINMPPNKSYKDYLSRPTHGTFSFKSIKCEDIINVINNLKPKSSFGADKMTNKMLKILKDELNEPITNIINQSFKTGIFPDLLKIAKVTPIYKKNENYLLENYRPISILPSISKVFERVMHNQIYDYFTKMNIFFTSQYGFRSRHSTELAALELVDRIITEMDNNHYPVNIFMDLSKAFDTLDHQILLDKLAYYGFQNESLNLLTNYLSKRQQYVEINQEASKYQEIKCGVPQGSILGPLLFIIYMNDMPSITEYFTFIIYADDTTLFTSLCTDDTSSANITALNTELNIINDWLKVNKLSLNIEKTKAMIFHSPQKQLTLPSISIENIKINFVDTFTFLGISIDKHLKWKSHIDMIARKISKAIGVLNKLKKFIPKSAMKLIYNALVLSHMNYGLMLWGSKHGKLFKLQKKAIRILNNSAYNAHTSPLFKIDNILKLPDLYAAQESAFCYRLLNGLLPQYFTRKLLHMEITHGYQTRHAGGPRTIAVRHEFARESISYRYPKIFNNMSALLKDKIRTHSLSGFKYYFKRTRVQSYETECYITNCYICNHT